MFTYILAIASVMVCITGCGQAPQGASIDPSAAPAEATFISSAPDASPSPDPSASPAAVETLTLYQMSKTTAPQAGWPTKTYTATGYCVIYQSQTYCWDDGIKTLAWSSGGSNYGPFYYTYWNMSQDAVGWSHANGGLQSDLMAAPRLISMALDTNMAAGSVSQVITGGTQTSIDCSSDGVSLTCPNFTVDLTQAPL